MFSICTVPSVTSHPEMIQSPRVDVCRFYESAMLFRKECELLDSFGVLGHLWKQALADPEGPLCILGNTTVMSTGRNRECLAPNGSLWLKAKYVKDKENLGDIVACF